MIETLVCSTIVQLFSLRFFSYSAFFQTYFSRHVSTFISTFSSEYNGTGTGFIYGECSRNFSGFLDFMVIEAR